MPTKLNRMAYERIVGDDFHWSAIVSGKRSSTMLHGVTRTGQPVGEDTGYTIMTPDERDSLRAAAYERRLTAEHLPLIRHLADDLDEDNYATAAVVIRELVRLSEEALEEDSVVKQRATRTNPLWNLLLRGSPELEHLSDSEILAMVKASRGPGPFTSQAGVVAEIDRLRALCDATKLDGAEATMDDEFSAVPEKHRRSTVQETIDALVAALETAQDDAAEAREYFGAAADETMAAAVLRFDSEFRTAVGATPGEFPLDVARRRASG